MKITTKNVLQIKATDDECVCLEIANVVLGEILNYLEDTCGNFGEGVLLHNPTTGEIVHEEELMRARGVLQFFLDNPLLEIQV
jgi:hypothetical protein